MIFSLLLFSQFAQAEELMSGTRYLRAASLDLLGRLPTMEEYEQIEDDGDIPDALLDQWLESDEFLDQAVYYHNLLLLNDLEFAKFQNFTSLLQRSSDGILYIVRRGYRQGKSSMSHNPPCGNFPAVFDDFGQPIAFENPDGSLDEGYVEVEPYWAPGTTEKVCAFEAQETTISTMGHDCRTDSSDSECGCGPNLNHCTPYFGLGVYHEIVNDFDEQINQMVRRVISERRPYTELLVGDSLLLNGPLTHMYKHLVFNPHGTIMENPPFDRQLMPDLHYTDADTWVEISGLESHSGVFTLPGFLLRFHTNRRRAERVLSEFLCTELTPPPQGLPESTGNELFEADLRVQSGCAGCHSQLDPMAAHWGRWTEGGASWVDPADYPSFSEECNEIARHGYDRNGIAACRNQGYLVDEYWGEDVGWYWSHASLADSEQHWPIQGPKSYLKQRISDATIPACVVQKASNQLLGRALNSRDEQWGQDLTRDFISNNYDYLTLIKSIITSKQYRRRL